ncbi:HesA/MoeB/ThiF family protein [Thermogladius sp. 4427co]|uniref:HesA/MoeB/ThiF family protein n=1 Tax=Thermogladius sp. 4427co TaxID=3450718 RepID=UPI003F7AA3AD
MLSSRELDFYSRHLNLIGVEGQLKLKKARVLVAGLGGLGSAVSLYLSAMGVGKLILVDREVVELSNLQRQVLYSVDDIGKPKPYAAADRLRRLNPFIDIEPVYSEISEGLLSKYDVDVYVDALDNWQARFILDKVAWSRGKPLVHGGVREYYGQVTVIIPGKTPCLRSIFPSTPKQDVQAPLQVFSTTPGTIGLIQAFEVAKLILGIGNVLANKLLIYNGLHPSFEIIEFKPDPQLISKC